MLCGFGVPCFGRADASRPAASAFRSGVPAEARLPDAPAGRSREGRAWQGAVRRQLPVLSRRRHARRRRRAEPPAIVNCPRRSARRAHGAGDSRGPARHAEVHADRRADRRPRRFRAHVQGRRLRRVPPQTAQHRRRRREGRRSLLQREVRVVSFDDGRSAGSGRENCRSAAAPADVADARQRRRPQRTAAGAGRADHRHCDVAVGREDPRQARSHRRLHRRAHDRGRLAANGAHRGGHAEGGDSRAAAAPS